MSKSWRFKALIILVALGAITAVTFQNCAKRLEIDQTQNSSSNTGNNQNNNNNNNQSGYLVFGNFPSTVVVNVGQTLTLNVPTIPTGASHLFYLRPLGQSQETLLLNGQVDTYTKPNVQLADAGIYRVVAMLAGEQIVATIIVTVNAAGSPSPTPEPTPVGGVVPPGCPGNGATWAVAQSIYKARLPIGETNAVCRGGVYCVNSYTYWVSNSYKLSDAHAEIKAMPPGPGCGT